MEEATAAIVAGNEESTRQPMDAGYHNAAEAIRLWIWGLLLIQPVFCLEHQR